MTFLGTATGLYVWSGMLAGPCAGSVGGIWFDGLSVDQIEFDDGRLDLEAGALQDARLILVALDSVFDPGKDLRER
jgi:hypothetical protein